MLAVGLAAVHPVAQGAWSRGLRRHHAVWSGAGDRHPARARGTFGPGSLADRQRRSVGQAPLAVRLDELTSSGGGREAGRSGWPRSPARFTCWSHPATSASRRLVAAWTIAAGLQVVLARPLLAALLSLPTPGIALVVATALADCLGALIGASKPKGGASRRSARSIAGLLGAALILIVAIAATLVIQVRTYLLVPPQELTVRYKGGGQWVVLRALGQSSPGARASGPIRISTSGAGKARSTSTASSTASRGTSSWTTCFATRPSGTIR